MRRSVLVACVIAGVASCAFSSLAHMPIPSIKGDRLIELRLGDEPIRIVYRIGFGATLANTERKAADTDGDSVVSAAEGNARLDERTRELLAALSVCTGPKLDALECKKLDRRAVERLEAEGWQPEATGHLHLAWTLALRERANQIGAIRIDDEWDVPGIEVTDLRFAPPTHAALELSGVGDPPTGVAERVSIIEERRPPGPRRLVAVWPAPKSTTRGKIALLLAIAALFAAGGFWASRRRSS